jgi:hypothetical protein
MSNLLSIIAEASELEKKAKLSERSMSDVRQYILAEYQSGIGARAIANELAREGVIAPDGGWTMERVLELVATAQGGQVASRYYGNYADTHRRLDEYFRLYPDKLDRPKTPAERWEDSVAQQRIAHERAASAERRKRKRTLRDKMRAGGAGSNVIMFPSRRAG